MNTDFATAPFGRRSVSLGRIAAGLKVRDAIEEAGKPGSNAPAAVNKWQLSRTLVEARVRLGVSDRSLSVLNALLSFHPETALSLPKPRRAEADEGDAASGTQSRRTGQGGGYAPASCDLIVFPSNKALAQRAHGMAPATLWRHLTALVEAGLILRRDSPNGKRYARKDVSGQERFSDAFGFDLTPLVARAGEFEAMAEELRAAARRRYLTKERISLLRRDVTKMIALGLDEGFSGDWEDYRARAMALMIPLRRIREDRDVEVLADGLAQLRAETAKALESCVNGKDSKSNAHHSEEHQSNTNTQSPSEFEPALKKPGSNPQGLDGSDGQGGDAAVAAEAPEPKSIPLGLVLEACPDISGFARDGAKIRAWPSFLETAKLVRSMLGISPDAWREAVEVLGETGAAIAVAAILQRSEHSSEAGPVQNPETGVASIQVNGSPAIKSPGGYLRALTAQARAGEFAIGPVLMALIGQRVKGKRAGG